MANDKTAITSPERAKLAAKIDERRIAEKGVADARSALTTAHRNWLTACIARDKIEDATPTEADVGEALVASLLSGDVVGSAEIDDPRA